jgi:fructose-1,6-bisphosphatase/inositol monophosphatase family enzyme
MLTYDPNLAESFIKDLVFQAMDFISTNRFSFIARSKDSYGGEEGGDVFTNIDKGAQNIYQDALQLYFPNFGLCGEEDGLWINPEATVWFAFDPIDGTKAYIRMQMSGVTTMFAMIDGDKIVASYIGDPFTGEVIGYGPVNQNVYRYSRVYQDQILLNDIKVKDDPEKTYLISLAKESDMTTEGRALVKQFKNLLVQNSSIGTIVSQLFTGIVGGILLAPHWDTPWDNNPLIGIAKTLGYRMYKYSDTTNKWVELDTKVVRDVKEIKYEVLITHPNLIARLKG